MGLPCPRTRDNEEDLYWGRELEAPVLRALEKRAGRPLVDQDQWGARLTVCEFEELVDDEGVFRWIARRPDEPWMLSTFDGIAEHYSILEHSPVALEGVLGMGNVEAKTIVAQATHKWIVDGVPRVPSWVRAQVTWNLAVSGLMWACVPFLAGGRRFYVADLIRDSRQIDKLVPLMREWWQRHVVGGVEPSVRGRDLPMLRLMYTQERGDEVTLDAPEFLQADEDFRQAQASKTSAEELLASAKATIIRAMGSASFAFIPGTPGPALYSFTTTASGTRSLRRGKRPTYHA